MKDEQLNEQFRKALISVAIQLAFLIGGIILLGLGTNFYISTGLACLLIYNKSLDR